MARRLTDDVWWLELGWRAPLGANAFLVDTRDSAADGAVTLVDAGLPFSTWGIRSELAAVGYEVGEIDRVLVTHYDLDHTGGLARLGPDLDAPVYIGAADAALARGDGPPSLAHHKGLFHHVASHVFPMPDRLDVTPVDDGETIGGFTAFHTPGHNPGHMVYVDEEAGVGLLGDLVWEDDGALTTPFWLDSYDMHALRESVRALADRAPPFDLACMGHGTPLTSGGSEALRALADRL